MTKKKKELAFIIYGIRFCENAATENELIRALESPDFMEEADLVVKPIEQVKLEEEALNAFEHEKKIKPGLLILLSDNLEDVQKADKTGIPSVFVAHAPLEARSDVHRFSETAEQNLTISDSLHSVGTGLMTHVRAALEHKSRIPVMRGKVKPKVV